MQAVAVVGMAVLMFSHFPPADSELVEPAAGELEDEGGVREADASRE